MSSRRALASTLTEAKDARRALKGQPVNRARRGIVPWVRGRSVRWSLVALIDVGSTGAD